MNRNVAEVTSQFHRKDAKNAKIISRDRDRDRDSVRGSGRVRSSVRSLSRARGQRLERVCRV